MAAHGTLGLAGYVQARHRRLDELAQEAYGSGVRQVVLLGAGFDARPWRFGRAWVGARVYVVDHPSTARARRESMAHLGSPGVDQVEVEVDFGREDLGVRLLEAGFDPQAPGVFLWEGVSMYLSEAAVRTTLDTLARLSAPGSWLGFDLFRLPNTTSARDFGHRQALRILGWIGEPVLFAIEPTAASTLLDAHGWQLAEALDHHALAARYRTDRRAIYAHAWVAIAQRA